MTRPTAGGVTVTVRVAPRASKPSLTVDADGTLRARLHAPPVDGAANEELIEMLADAFGLPRRAVVIVGGAQSRTKRVRLEGIDGPRAAKVLGALRAV
jgi:uncharacterized protein (TIGR00251 family)